MTVDLQIREVQPLIKVPEKTVKRMWFSKCGGLIRSTDAHRTPWTDLLAAVAPGNDFIYLAATQVPQEWIALNFAVPPACAPITGLIQPGSSLTVDSCTGSRAAALAVSIVPTCL